VFAEIMRRVPFIHSSLEQQVFDESWIWPWSLAGCQFMNFIGGPLTKAITSTPETPITEPSTLAIPCTCFMEILSILKFWTKPLTYIFMLG
jgi:hypothetical protein